MKYLFENAHYDYYDERIAGKKYTDEQIRNVLDIADQYIDEAEWGVISYDQMDKYANLMGLEQMSDRQLRDAWDMYNLIINREAFSEDSDNYEHYRKYSDCASAFAEVINREALRRKATGNYNPDED